MAASAAASATLNLGRVPGALFRRNLCSSAATPRKVKMQPANATPICESLTAPSATDEKRYTCRKKDSTMNRPDARALKGRSKATTSRSVGRLDAGRVSRRRVVPTVKVVIEKTG
jgi:hypothetical protein